MRRPATGHALGRLWSRAGDSVVALGLFGGALTAYVCTLAPSLVALFDDSLEFPLVVRRLAIAHPTGYPLYILLGKLFSLFTRPNTAYGVNLLSAVAAALTVALVYLAGRELTRRPARPRPKGPSPLESGAWGRLPALLGALALACSPIFWSQAVVAEVYTLNSAFVAALLWLALRWARRPLLPLPRPPAAAVTAAGTQPVRTGRARRRAGLLLAADANRPGGLRRRAAAAWERAGRVLGPAGRRLAAVYRRLYPAIPASGRLRLQPLALVIAAVAGLALTHHRTILLLTGPLLVFALLVERRVFSRAALLGVAGARPAVLPRWRRAIATPGFIAVACLLAPLLLYLYLPLRGHIGSLDGTYHNTLGGFWQWVLGSSYSVFLGENPLARDLGPAFYADLLWQQLGPVGLGLAALGVLRLALPSIPGENGSRPVPLIASLDWTRPAALALTGLAFIVYLAFAVVYRVPDVEVFLIPAWVVVAVWMAVGLDWVAGLLRPRGSSPLLRRLLATAGVVLFAAAAVQPLSIAARHWPDLDLSRRWAVDDYGRFLLRDALPPGSTVVGLLGEMNLLRYVQDEGLGGAVETEIADDEAARRQAIDRALGDGNPVYITRPLPGLDADYALGAVAGVTDVAGESQALIRVAPVYYEVPAPAHTLELRPAPGLRLIGYELDERQAHWQAWARLRLWWRTPNGTGDRLKVSARLVNGDGQVVAAVDAEPVANAYPTTAWRPGEVVADAYEIPLPAGLPPGDYRPLVVVYDPATGAERGRAELPAVHLAGNPARPPRRELEASVARPSYVLFGDVELLGWTPPDAARAYGPGEALPVTLLWQARAAGGPPEGARHALFWLEGTERIALGGAPLGGDFKADAWVAGQVVRQWPVLSVPAGTPAGSYRLTMRVLRDAQPVPWGRWLLPLGTDLTLGTVDIID